MLRWNLIFFLLLGFPKSCFAVSKLAEGTGIGWYYYIKLFLSLGLILGIIYLLAYFLKTNLPQQNNVKSLKIADKIYLEHGVSLYLVKIIDNIWVIGVGNKEIKLIEKLQNTDCNLDGGFINNKQELKSAMDNAKNEFLRYFKKFFSKKDKI